MGKQKTKQLNVRIPEELMERLQNTHSQFQMENNIDVSFNAYLTKLLNEAATREEAN